MKSLFRLTLIISGLALLAHSTLAQTSPAPEPQPSASVAPALLTIDFPGGSFTKLCSMIASSPGASFNVIGEKADMEVTLPPFSVHNVNLEGLANALNTLLIQRGLTLVPSGKDVFTLFKPDPNAGRETAFASFQIARCLQFQTVDDITAAIRTAWQLNPSHDEKALQLKYHPPTTLLLVSGSPAAVGVAERVIHSLKPLDQVALAAQNESAPAPSPSAPPKE